MKIVNYKLKIVKVVTLSVSILLLPAMSYGAGLVPCTGLDCSFCHFFLLFQNLLNFIVKDLTPLIAVVMVVYAGYKFLIAGPNPDALSSAKKILYNTFIGLAITVVAFSATSGLMGFFASKFAGGSNFGFNDGVFTISCSQVSPAVDLSKWLNNGKVTVTIKGEDAPKGGASTFTTDLRVINDVGVAGDVDWSGVNHDTWNGLQNAANDPNLYDKGVGLVVTSGYRSVVDQNQVALDHCKNPASGACEPKPGKSIACIPKNDGSNCSHTTGRAVDVHGFQNGKQCDDSGPCQRAVIAAMRAQGFCNLINPPEPWHFEYPPRADKTNCN